jgi:hypothetical protein
MKMIDDMLGCWRRGTNLASVNPAGRSTVMAPP